MSETLHTGGNPQGSTRKRLYIAFDFDGTIVTNKFPDVGVMKPKTIALMHKLHEAGHCIIIWTCRQDADLQVAVEWLKANNVPFDYVNENPEFDAEAGFVYHGGKIFYHCLFDDRALNAADISMFLTDNPVLLAGLENPLTLLEG